MIKNNRYSLKELSCELEISVRDLRKYIRQGRLRASRVGRTYWITSEDMNEFLEKTSEFPSRNYLCRNYDTCLDIAARSNKVFECKGCKKFTLADKRELSTPELLGMLSLWKSVFGTSISVQ